jgi:putative ABC transport system permease protein
MKGMLSLACRSAWNRRFVVMLVVLSIAFSTFLLMTLERVRADVRDAFSQSVSGTDLIVGPRGGRLELLLYSVFRWGSAGGTMQWSSANAIGSHRSVAWWVPLSLGDSHRGFPVLATTPSYFEHFRFGRRERLQFELGGGLGSTFNAVLGADVAQALGYELGDRIVLSHGTGAADFNDHTDQPFTVAGILRRTGTPVDRTIHIGLEGMDAIHANFAGGVALPSAPGARPDADGSGRTITAMLVGLKNRASVFSVQRDVQEFRGEALMALLPGVVLDELWQAVGGTEQVLRWMTGFVGAVSLAGLVAVVLAGLEQRRRELAILRAVGAGPSHVMLLLCAEGALITIAGALAGAMAHWLAVALLDDWLRLNWGVQVVLAAPGAHEFLLLGAIVGCGLAASLLPGLRAYRMSLADGLSPQV